MSLSHYRRIREREAAREQAVAANRRERPSWPISAINFTRL
jgi:hypothetical protein